MKPQFILVALFAGFISTGVLAAETETASPTEAKVQPQPKPMKPHSAVQDKTGIPQTAPVPPDPGKKDPWKDKSKHFHPRDGK